jgi:hypothetical protein
LLKKNEILLENHIGEMSGLLVCGFNFIYLYLESASLLFCTEFSQISGVGYGTNFENRQSFKENTIIELILNMEDRTLKFLINGYLIPCKVVCISTLALYFGITGHDSFSTIDFSLINDVEVEKEEN